ncbi:unnamed protein product [Mytilus coruscus]|uniref:C-type lectin domain-containing protein n=1 Tax=Mytilus coruscus TaxID=42192 RepID=A0A6J8DHA0_MYTCO|nr:unnamed protein product [Mytilus coruscus]
MKIQLVAALLCLIMFLHSEGKYLGSAHYKGRAKGHYKSRNKGHYELGGKIHNHDKYKSTGNSPSPCEAPCKSLPTTCPKGYTKLCDQTISPNCYLFGGNSMLDFTSWHVALARCLNTPGAYLWIPETLEEAEAVRVKFNIIEAGFDVYTGANNLADNNTYVFAVTNDPFDWDNLAFGIQDGNLGLEASSGCLELEFNFYDNGTAYFGWDSDKCGEELEAYICEFPIASSS